MSEHSAQPLHEARKAAGRPDLQFRTLRVTHATRLMLDGSSLKETMDASDM